MQLFDYDRASTLMKQSRMDVILASSKHGVGYLSDYWHPVSDDYYLLWDTKATHKTFVGIPSDESRGPFIVAGASEATTIALFDPWIEDRRYWGPGYYIQTWDNPLDPDPDPGEPMQVVADALTEKGLADATIGIEERYLGIKYARRLQELLPRATFVDAEDVLWGLRIIKSKEEIRRSWEACIRTGKAWLNTIHAAQEGMTERDLQRVFAQMCLAEELDYERAYAIFGPAGLSLVNGSPPSLGNELKRGQFIRIDAQGKYEGYICNLSRIVAFGDVSEGMEKAHAIERGLVERMMPELKPGVKSSHIREVELELYKDIGYPPVVPYTGHGVGRVVHEPPYLALNDETVLQPNMIVTLEPTICYSEQGDVFVSIEDQFVINENGADWQTESAPMDLHL